MNPPLTQRIPRQIVGSCRIDGNACEIDNRSEFLARSFIKTASLKRYTQKYIGTVTN
jgi:hypothetical protein